MKSHVRRSILVACWLCMAAAAVAKPRQSHVSEDGRAVKETRPAAADVLVTIKNINGTITVAGWERKEVEVTGTVSGDAEGLDVTGTEKRIKIEVRYPENEHNVHVEADLDVKVPVGAGVRVSVVNSPITVSKVEGEVELEAVNGDIEVSGKPASVEAQSVNGTIGVMASTDRAEVETVNGRIVLDGVSGDVSAGTVGGSIQVTGGKLERGKFSSVSGDIDFSGSLDGKGTFDFETHNGDIQLQLPASVSAEFEVSTFSGDIQNDFGPTGTKRQFGPGRELSFSTGSGDARVTINTFSGDVRLVRK